MTKNKYKQKPIMVESRITVAQRSPLAGILMEILLFCMALIGYLYCNTTALDMKIPYAVVPIIAILSLGIMILFVWYKRVFFSVLGSVALLGLIAFPLTKNICAAIGRSAEIWYNYIIYKLTLQPNYESYVDHMTLDLTDMLKNETVLSRHFYIVLILLSLLSALFFALALFRRIPILCTFIVPVLGMVPFFFYGIVPHYIAFSIFLSAVIGCYSQSAVQWLSRRRRRKRAAVSEKDQKKEKQTVFKRLEFAGKHGVFGSITAAVMLVVTIGTATLIYSRPIIEMQKVRDALDRLSEDAMSTIFRSTYEKNLQVGGFMEDGETLSMAAPNWRNLPVATVYAREAHPVYLRYRTMVNLDENGWSIPNDAFLGEYSASVESDFLEYTQFYEYLRLTASGKDPVTAKKDEFERFDEGYILDHVTITPKYKVSNLMGLPGGVTTREPTSDYNELEQVGDTVLIAHDEPENRGYLYQVVSPTFESSIFLTNFQKTQDTYINLRLNHPDDPYMYREAEYSRFVQTHYTENTADVDYMVRKLTLEQTAPYPTKLTKIQAIERYFRENYKYSAERQELIVETGEEGNAYDYLYNFLTNNKKKEGYCTLFASAMVSMVRSLGFPARVATGYYAKPIMRAENDYAVAITDMNFHAWVEVYFDGMGWVTFEPTPGFGNEPNYYLLELVDEQLVPMYEENVKIEYDYSGQTNSEYVKYNNKTLPDPQLKPEKEEEKTPAELGKPKSALTEQILTALKIILAVLLLVGVLALSEIWRRRTLKKVRTAPPTEGVRKSYYLILRLMQVLGFKFFEGELLEDFAIRADNMEFVSLSLSDIVPILQKGIYSEDALTVEEHAAVYAYVKELDRAAFRRANPIKAFWYKLTLHWKPKHQKMIWSFK